MKQTEKQFQQAVLDYAKLTGWKTFHPFDSRRSAAGFPDLTLTRDEEIIFIELKTERGKLSADQKEWGDSLQKVANRTWGELDAIWYEWGEGPEPNPNAPAVRYFVWRPSDWSEIEATLGREPA